MSTAAELLDPEVLASIKAEFHDVFMEKREEVRKLRAAMRVSKSAHSGLNEYQAASEDGALVGTKRSREGAERLIRPLKRPRIIEDLSKTSSGAMKDPDLWENHTFAELSPTGSLQGVRKVRVREELYGALCSWKEVERGMVAYDEHGCYRICQVNCFRSRDVRGTLHDRNETLTPEKTAAAVKDRSILPAFPPLDVPTILVVESPDGQSAILPLSRDKTDNNQATHEPLDLWPHLKPGINKLTINLAASPTIRGSLPQRRGQPHVDHTEEDGYIFILQITEPTVDHLKLAILHPSQKGPFEGFRNAMQAIAAKVKSVGAAA